MPVNPEEAGGLLLATRFNNSSELSCRSDQVEVMQDDALDRSRINTWMEKACSGDIAAFGRLSDAVQDELFRLALSLGTSWDDAVEATQETLMRAFAKRKAWRRGSDVLGWLCGICVNVCREQRRREMRKQLWFKEMRRNHLSTGQAEDAVLPTMGSDQVFADEMLGQAIARLPERQREAIACRYLRRMSISDTAKAMGCAEGTVKSAVAAAIKQLQQMLMLEADHEAR
jgi:RNA polymerase sigma-70 factor, ECF subfamily